MAREVISASSEKNMLVSLVEVANLNVGDGFGELALLNDGPRLATITCKEESHFATLNKENFRAILGFFFFFFSIKFFFFFFFFYFFSF